MKFRFVMCHQVHRLPIPYNPNRLQLGFVEISADTEEEAVADFMTNHKPAECGLKSLYWYDVDAYDMDNFREPL